MRKLVRRRRPRSVDTRVRVVRNAMAIQAQRPETPGVLGVFERLARDPKLTVDKLGRLIELQEHIMAAEAKAAFDQAYNRMQPTIPVISRRGVIRNRAGEVQSRYSKYEDIRKVVDPILHQHGFHVHSRTEWPETGVLEVVGVLTHDCGHSRESRFRTTADESGGKNAIQGLGSGVSYGKRYTLIDLLAIVCEGQDDDGQAHSRNKAAKESTPEVVPPVHHANAGDPITDAQRKRLFVLMKNAGRQEVEMRAWLKAFFGWTSTKDITRRQYEFVCAAIEASGPLPAVREPGEDG